MKVAQKRSQATEHQEWVASCGVWTEITMLESRSDCVVQGNCALEDIGVTPPPLYKPCPCPSYSRRRDRNSCVRNLITYEM